MLKNNEQNFQFNVFLLSLKVHNRIKEKSLANDEN